MPDVAVLDHDAVLAAVSAREAIDRTREAFLRHRRGEWLMPAKVYLESPPHGDFRAMPALGGGLAILKWISSFPSNPADDIAFAQRTRNHFHEQKSCEHMDGAGGERLRLRP